MRMTANLNALAHARVALGPATRAIVGERFAHHVLDPDAVAGLNPLHATDLASALPALLASEQDGWVLGLPSPGALLPLRGPRRLNEAALEVGQLVIARSAGLALVPYLAGRGVQWRIFAAERPFAGVSPYEAERMLNEAVLSAASTLARLDTPGGTRPRAPATTTLAPGYSPRQLATADRAVRLLEACEIALADDGGSISAHEAAVRARELRGVRDAASQAVCAACSWLDG